MSEKIKAALKILFDQQPHLRLLEVTTGNPVTLTVNTHKWSDIFMTVDTGKDYNAVDFGERKIKWSRYAEVVRKPNLQTIAQVYRACEAAVKEMESGYHVFALRRVAGLYIDIEKEEEEN